MCAGPGDSIAERRGHPIEVGLRIPTSSIGILLAVFVMVGPALCRCRVALLHCVPVRAVLAAGPRVKVRIVAPEVGVLPVAEPILTVGH